MNIPSSSRTDPQFRNWLELPRDVMEAILHRLGAVEILMTAQYVCSTWRRLCKNRSMWLSIDMRNSGNLGEKPCDLEKICREAVDRGCGELVDINVMYFGTDDLVKYIADSSSQLRRLRLVHSLCITAEGLIEAAPKLPLLEELDLSHDLSDCLVSKESMEVVGRSCPLLKSLNINTNGFRGPMLLCDEVAVAIAKNMPKLRHLQVLGNKMTNDGLQAILDGCPLLESLDLRQCFNVQCFNVTLGRDLKRRCTERIKDLRLPDDPTDDCEFDASTDYDDPTDDSEFDASIDDDDDGSFDEDFYGPYDADDYYEFSDGVIFDGEYYAYSD